MTLGLLCVSALVSGAETSFFSLSHNDIRRLRKRTTASAEAVLRLLTNVDLLLATILVVNNLVNICIVILTSSIIDSVFTFLRFEFLFKPGDHFLFVQLNVNLMNSRIGHPTCE